MRKAQTVTYAVKSGLYVNLTNRCPCACTFCIRQNADHVYEEKDSLWLGHEPDFGEVREALLRQDVASFTELVFCGYGEPTEALDVLLQTARFVKERYSLPVRLNTNGLGDLINGRPVAPLLTGLVDTVSVSLNSGSPELYEKTVRPVFKEKAYPAMLAFAKACTTCVPKVVMTTVGGTISAEDEERCAGLCRRLGVGYRIREYAGGRA